MIVIIGAQQEETLEIKNKMNVENTYKFLNYDVYEGTLNGVSVVLTSGGIGKVGSTIITSTMLNKYDVSRVINVGTCGGVGDVKPYDIIVGNHLVYLDADVRAFNYEYGQMAGCPRYFSCDIDGQKVLLKYDAKSGDMVSGDSFVTKNHLLYPMISSFKDMNIKTIDMEATSIAQTCFTYGVKFNIIRIVSDRLEGSDQITSYEEVLKYSSKKIAEILYDAIINL